MEEKKIDLYYNCEWHKHTVEECKEFYPTVCKQIDYSHVEDILEEGSTLTVNYKNPIYKPQEIYREDSCSGNWVYVKVR